MRFDSDVTFSPVPSAADVFVVGGNSLSTGIRDAAAAVAANDRAGMNASLAALAHALSHGAHEHAKIGLSGGRLDPTGDSHAARDRHDAGWGHRELVRVNHVGSRSAL